MRVADRGFTLLEVLVALVIVGTALAASSRAVTSLLQNGESMRVMSVATWLAENQLINLRLSGKWPEVAKTDQDCSQDRFILTCHQEVRPTQNPAFRRVEVSVIDPRDPQRSITKLVEIVSHAQ